MAQPFSYRHPIIQGQGNFGSHDDPKSFAAMRYTEAKLSEYAQIFLKELGPKTTLWRPNFDGSLLEPAIMPARLPNILLNGGTGIAVGMATDIPPHNCQEVINACILLLTNKNVSLEEILEYIPAPDYPVGGEIINSKQELLSIYQTGHGSIKQRATYENTSETICFVSTPHQTSSSKIIKQIAEQMQNKKLPMIKNVLDESDEENPVHITLFLKNNRVNKETLISHLFATTDLEKNQRVNLNYIGLDKKPITTGLKDILTTWLSFRKQTITYRLEYRKEQIEARLHILLGILLIYAHIDEVIHIIRTADDSKKALVERFSISEIQAQALLEIRLKQLAKLEEIALESEKTKLQAELEKINTLLSSPAALKKLMIKELKEDALAFSSPRRSIVNNKELSKSLKLVEHIPVEPMTIVLSEKGWIRSAKTHDINFEQVSFKSGDKYSTHAQGKSNQPLVLFDQAGKTYTLPPLQLPSIRTQGEPLTKYLNLSENHAGHLLLEDPKTTLVLMSSLGYGFITEYQHLISKNKAGKHIISLPKTATILPPLVKAKDDVFLALISQQGRLLICPLDQVPQLNKGKGNKLIQIHPRDITDKTDQLAFAACLKENQFLVLQSGRRQYTLSPKEQIPYKQERAKRGHLLPRGFRRVTQAKAND